RRNVGHLVAGDEGGAEGAGADKVLAGGELVRMVLPVAHRAVVVARVSGHVLEGLLGADVSSGPADDDGQLALVIEFGGDLGPDNGVARGHLAGGKAGKDGGMLFYGSSGFKAVGFVVEAYADDFARVGNDGKQMDFMRGKPGGQPQHGIGLVQPAAEQRLEVGVAMAEQGTEMGNLVFVELGAVAGLAAAGHKREKTH